MILFTKLNCDKCTWVKKEVGLDRLNALEVKIEVLPDKITLDTDIARYVESVAHAAYHEIIGTAEKMLPILVVNDTKIITGAIKIKNYLMQATNRRIL